ncbi:unnamed protein product [marine sediment metagenome]|uniref:Radical SAM core domain-containing protein n=1 Tax=marine sediment metagenome TaxID=412755 RepID=X1MSS7_9ZZZZ
MSRMFKSIDQTWNVFVGCLFDCSYCNARKAALTRLKHSPRYKDGFKPHLVEAELKRTFKPGEFIFVAYMGDIAFASRYEVAQILIAIQGHPDTRFLIQTKDPGCFHRWKLPIPPNVVLGTTIETSRDYHLTKAPLPIDRARSLINYPHPHKFLSIEPIMDFELPPMEVWTEALKPEIIEVGADNYHNNLPEPPGEKLRALLNHLGHICPKVIEKDGLERLKRSN